MCELRAALALALAVAAGAPALAEPRVSILDVGFSVSQLSAPGSLDARVAPTTDALRPYKLVSDPVVILRGERGAAAVYLRGGELKVQSFSPAAESRGPGEPARGALAGSRVQSAGAITVHIAGPTTAYEHGALGGRAEARELVVSERQAVAMAAGAQKVPVARTRVEAGPDAVFEDREPRLADLDGDSVPEVLVVKSYLERGSALAVVAKRDGDWRVVAETPPIGTPRRWLNPAAVAAVGGGGPEIALVRSPHLAGVLQVWAFDRDRLVLRAEAVGYSNHVFGSPAQALAAAVDLDGDGVPELAIPTLERTALALLSLKGGIKELARVTLPGRAAAGVAVLGTGKAARILVGLEDGRVADVRP